MKNPVNLILALFIFAPLPIALAASDAPPPAVKAVYHAAIPHIDGVPDPLIWEQAEGYSMALSRDKEGQVLEGAEVKYAWNPYGLYVAIQVTDSDLVANKLEDEQKHYLFGDVVELFVKPQQDSYYWEMYVTPAGNKTTIFFFRSAGGKIFSDILEGHDFRALTVAATPDGTVNQRQDTDTGWTAEMWVPAEQLKHFGESWGTDGIWSVLCARYNFNKDRAEAELSMTPSLSRTSYHLTDEYAHLIFLPAAAE